MGSGSARNELEKKPSFLPRGGALGLGRVVDKRSSCAYTGATGVPGAPAAAVEVDSARREIVVGKLSTVRLLLLPPPNSSELVRGVPMVPYHLECSSSLARALPFHPKVADAATNGRGRV